MGVAAVPASTTYPLALAPALEYSIIQMTILLRLRRISITDDFLMPSSSLGMGKRSH